jgi:hypothetical protein
VRDTSELERPLAAVEHQLLALGEALQQHDSAAVDRVAADLHTALAAAVDHFARAARSGSSITTIATPAATGKVCR